MAMASQLRERTANRPCTRDMSTVYLSWVCCMYAREKERECVKISGTIFTLGDTKDQSLSPVTLKQTFLCDVKPWSSLEPMPFGIVAFSNAS